MSLDDRVNDACHRIEDLYNETDGHCYVAFSGGKDSTVLLALIRMCEEVFTIPQDGIPAVFSNTGIELGVTVNFVKWVRDSGWYPNVQITYPEKPFGWILEHEGKPMKSKFKSELLHRWHTGKRTEYVYCNLLEGRMPNGRLMRTRVADKDMHILSDDFDITPSPACCTYLKKNSSKGWADAHDMKGSLVGLRTAEGGIRRMQAERRVKEGGKLCTYFSHGSIRKAPIIDWSDAEVDEFVQKYNVPLSDAYTKYGFDRTGCMGCPYSRNLLHDLQYLHDHEPNRYKASMHWLKDVYIAQNVKLPFDEAYERERERTWSEVYEPMRQEMLRKYRPDSRLIKDYDQTNIFEFMEEDDETD